MRYEKLLTGKSILSLSLSLSLILLAFPVPSLAHHGIPVTVFGTTSPDALVTIKVPELTLSIARTADENGRFIFTFTDVPPGVYMLFVSAMKDGSANETNQLIGVPDSPAVEEMSVSDINLPLAPVKPIKKQKADLNRDGLVDMRDLSILLYHWTSSMFYTPYNKDADLNGDDSINLKDVSLMISLWTN